MQIDFKISLSIISVSDLQRKIRDIKNKQTNTMEQIYEPTYRQQNDRTNQILIGECTAKSGGRSQFNATYDLLADWQDYRGRRATAREPRRIWQTNVENAFQSADR